MSYQQSDALGDHGTLSWTWHPPQALATDHAPSFEGDISVHFVLEKGSSSSELITGVIKVWQLYLIYRGP